jgi:hypothetical protein
MNAKLVLCGTMMMGACATGNALAQSTEALVGSWKLLSASATNANGVVDKTPYGANMTGVVTYTAGRSCHGPRELR